MEIFFQSEKYHHHHYTLQLSNHMLKISITLGFSAVLVCYYVYKFITKNSKIIPRGDFCLFTIFQMGRWWLLLQLWNWVKSGISINNSSPLCRNFKNYMSFVINMKKASIWAQPQLSSSNSLEVVLKWWMVVVVVTTLKLSKVECKHQ